MVRDTSDQRDAPTASTHSRRRYMTSLTTLGAVALAGCSSSDDGDADSGDSNGDSGNGDSGDGNTETEASGCPSLPLSYTEKRIEGSPTLTFEGPADATYQLSPGDTDGVGSGTVNFPQANGGESWLAPISGVTQDSGTVEEAVEADSLTETAEEVTGDYDLSDDSARVFLLEQQSTFSVYLSGEPNVVQVSVSPIPGPSDVACTDAATATVDRIVGTLQLVE